MVLVITYVSMTRVTCRNGVNARAQVEELKTINRELLEQVISHCPPPLPTHSPLLGGEPLRRTRTMPL